MLPLSQKIAFLLFAAVMLAAAAYTWRRLFRRIAAGRQDSDSRSNHLAKRIWYSLVTTLTQERTFRKRPVVSFFHSLIFYGFVFYLLVNFVDALEGFFAFNISSSNALGAVYNLLADVLSAFVLLAVVALVVRRFLLPSRRDFAFNDRTLLHPDLERGYVRFDSIVVSVFIFFHVGSRAIGAGARLAAEGTDPFQPFGSFVAHAFSPANANSWRIFGYWGALESVLAFLAYFPRSKHIHIFMAPAKYVVARDVSSGVLPALELNVDSDKPQLGANKLEDLAWPRLLDAYACIQCNRCQDVCPATATGKSLSPSALEINKRMELNELSKGFPAFEAGSPSPKPLLQFAMTPEAAWACTTCGACMEVCPVQDEPMLDIIDIRRHQVMIDGNFPTQLQSAFRGMERSNNPWGLSQDKRLDWAEGLNVTTTDENPEPDVLYWVGCAASYDPQAQKTARAFVQLLNHAGVDFAVLGKRECCTGDSARRAGNEFLYRQLADKNVATLNAVKPKKIVATCPHCMNTVGKEYAQLGGDYEVVHHTQYLDGLVREGKLPTSVSSSTVAFHDPCYLGRHNGVYDAPRNLLNILNNSVVELDRNRENSFCCGAGGAQFWKEEEPGEQRISDNRYAEAERKLSGASEKVLAVGCPFCKSMLESTPEKGSSSLAVKDIAELLLEGLTNTGANRIDTAQMESLLSTAPVESAVVASESERSQRIVPLQTPASSSIIPGSAPEANAEITSSVDVQAQVSGRKKWVPKRQLTVTEQLAHTVPMTAAPVAQASTDIKPPTQDAHPRKAWKPQKAAVSAQTLAEADSPTRPVAATASVETTGAPSSSETPRRNLWKPKVALSTPPGKGPPELETATSIASTTTIQAQEPVLSQASERKRWVPKRKAVLPEPDQEGSNR